MLGLFFVCVYTSQRTNEGFAVAKSINDIITTYPINEDSTQYKDITKKQEINEFIYNIILPQIYKEEIKDFPSEVKGCHYINYFNYFMGMRVTYNRAKLLDSGNIDETGKLKDRISNYDKNPNSKLENVETNPFGKDKIEYQNDGGYKNTGGYVIYFNSNLTYTEAETKYTQLAKDGLFDEYCISIVLEIMMYNGNYQTGVVISYEFLINNAASMFKDKDIDAFYMSRYSPNYARYSSSLKSFLIFTDALFLLYYLFLWILFAKKLKKRMSDLFVLRSLSFKFVDYLDLANISLIFAYIVLWMFVICFPPSIKLPVTEIKDFEKYRLLADRTTSHSIVSSIATITIFIRWIIYMTECYPAFGALFSTLIEAAKDLVVTFIILLIMMLGFIYASNIMFGCYVPSYNGFFQSFSYAMFDFTENPYLYDYSNRVPSKKLFSSFYIVFSIWFILVLAKLFLSIIIVRYLYLRSTVHLENKVRAKIIDRK